MPSVQARRTLVKSPPELWAELSDVEALGRRLESFGEIRITRLEPESTVAWEGERARGTVEIEPSGWGTRVTLTAEASAALPAGQAPDGQDDEPHLEERPVGPAAAAEPGASPDPPATEPEPEPAAEAAASEPELTPAAADARPPEEVPHAAALSLPSEPSAGGAVDETLPQTLAALGQDLPPGLSLGGGLGEVPATRRGFWSRLLRRGRVPAPAPASPAQPSQVDLPAAEPEPVEPLLPAAMTDPHPVPAPLDPRLPEPVPDPPPTEPAAGEAPPPEAATRAEAAEPEPEPQPTSPPEEAATATTTPPEAAEPLCDGDLDVVLTRVLDALGAAHHRPFSRS